MNLHAAIRTTIHEVIEGFHEADIISPTTVAQALQRRYSAQTADAHVQYASLEHFKHMARRALAGRYDAESDESEAHQGELFSGHLQSRYPIPRRVGEDPVYKLRAALTSDERAWNVETLRRSANARLLHADALEAEGQFVQAA